MDEHGRERSFARVCAAVTMVAAIAGQTYLVTKGLGWQGAGILVFAIIGVGMIVYDEDAGGSDDG